MVSTESKSGCWRGDRTGSREETALGTEMNIKATGEVVLSKVFWKKCAVSLVLSWMACTQSCACPTAQPSSRSVLIFRELLYSVLFVQYRLQSRVWTVWKAEKTEHAEHSTVGSIQRYTGAR